MPAPAAQRPKRLAVLDRTPEGWRLLVSRSQPAPAVEYSGEFALSDAAGLAGALRRNRADRVVRLIPPGSSICRPVGAPAPGGSPDQVAQALCLLAEAHLGEGIPPHRRSAGQMPVGGVAALGWAGNGVEVPPLSYAEAGSVAWCPSPAALSALAYECGAALALAADRETGVIVLVGTHDGKHVARVTRDDGSDPLEWRAALEVALASAAATLVIPEPGPLPADSGDSRLVVLIGPDGRALAPRAVAGADMSPSWLSRYGLPLGAALLAADPEPAEAPLLAMTPEPIIPPRPLVLRVVDWLAVPARAGVVIAACVVLALGWPLAAAAIRHARLQAVASADRADAGEETAARRQAEFYDLLRARRWPMSKLLADLTAAAPAGVTIESLTLEAGQRVRMSGVAESNQVIADWRAALQAGRIFDVGAPSTEASGNTIKFELSARVAQPLTLESGKAIAAVPVTVPAAESHDTHAGPAGGAAAAPGRAEPATSNAGARTGRRGAGGPAKPEVPGPITDEEIASLDRTAAMREFSTRRRAATTAGLDDETKARLNAEADKAKARMDELRASGDGAPAPSTAPPASAPPSTAPPPAPAPAASPPQPAPSPAPGGGS